MPYEDRNHREEKSVSTSSGRFRETPGRDRAGGASGTGSIWGDALWRLEPASANDRDLVLDLAVEMFRLTQDRADRKPATRQEFLSLADRLQNDFKNLAKGVLTYLSNQAPVSVQEARLVGLRMAAQIAQTHNTGKAASDAILREAGKKEG